MAVDLREALRAVVDDLDDAEITHTADQDEIVVGDRPIAIIGTHRMEILLDPIVATAAARTPDAAHSGRGEGWLAFTPASLDRFALDRAEAWLRSAYRRVSAS
jgi:hypothetical protein